MRLLDAHERKLIRFFCSGASVAVTFGDRFVDEIEGTDAKYQWIAGECLLDCNQWIVSFFLSFLTITFSQLQLLQPT